VRRKKLREERERRERGRKREAAMWLLLCRIPY
jgi:hypothetical protein